MGEILHFGKLGVKGVAAVCTAFAATAVLASSCVKRELHVKPDEGHVKIDFDWKNVPQGQTPPQDNMTVYFYGTDGTLKREVVQNGLCETDLASGTYKVLSWNENVEGVDLKNWEDFDKAGAYALPAPPAPGKADADGDTESWIQQPGWLYSASIAELTVNKEDTVVRTLVPEPLVRKLDLNFRISGDVDKVTKVSAALTGVAPSVRLASHECVDGYASIVGFTPKRSETDLSMYSGSVLVFGVNAKDAAGAVAKNLVKLWVEFNGDGNNSQTIQKETEVNLGGGTGSGNINIEINVEVSATSEAGFQVTVKGWEVTSDGVSVDNRPGGVPLASAGWNGSAL